MSEMVYVGKERLVGEVIALTKDTSTVQVFCPVSSEMELLKMLNKFALELLLLQML